jgi:hypothetical protein
MVCGAWGHACILGLAIQLGIWWRGWGATPSLGGLWSLLCTCISCPNTRKLCCLQC